MVYGPGLGGWALATGHFGTVMVYGLRIIKALHKVNGPITERNLFEGHLTKDVFTLINERGNKENEGDHKKLIPFLGFKLSTRFFSIWSFSTVDIAQKSFNFMILFWFLQHTIMYSLLIDFFINTIFIKRKKTKSISSMKMRHSFLKSHKLFNFFN